MGNRRKARVLALQEELGFVERYGTPGTDLTGLTIEGINGSGGAVTHSIALSGMIPADGLFVLVNEQSGGGTLVPDADQLASFDFQDGRTTQSNPPDCS